MRLTTALALLLTLAVVEGSSYYGSSSTAALPWQPELIASMLTDYRRRSSSSTAVFPSTVSTYRGGSDRQFLSDVPPDFEEYVTTTSRQESSTSNTLTRRKRRQQQEQRRKPQHEEATSTTTTTEEEDDRDVAAVRGTLQILKQRAQTRAQLANLLLQRRRKTLGTAFDIALASAKTSPTGRLLCNASAAVVCRGGSTTETSGATNAVVNGKNNQASAVLTSQERQALIDDTALLLENVQRALSNDELWGEPIAEKDGVRVWRTYADVKNLHKISDVKNAASSSSDGATVRSEAYLSASPEAVYQLLMDNARVHEYNDNCVLLQDIEQVDEHTKINWCATGKFGPFKPRDFVSLVHFRKLSNDEGYLNLAANVNHDKLGPADGFVRSEIQLSAIFMKPVPGQPNKTRFVQMTQVGQLGGAADSAMGKKIAQSLAEKAPIDFVKKFDTALLRGSPAPQPKSKGGLKQLPFEGIGSLSEIV